MGFVANLLMVVLLLTAVVLIVLVLIQRGKGGGLAGALGGMGGQSAFGTKAGDLFTKITIGVATFWIVVCIITVKVLGVGEGILSTEMGGAATQSPPGITAPPSTDKQPDAADQQPGAGEKPATGEGAASAAPAQTPTKGEAAP